MLTINLRKIHSHHPLTPGIQEWHESTQNNDNKIGVQPGLAVFAELWHVCGPTLTNVKCSHQLKERKVATAPAPGRLPCFATALGVSDFVSQWILLYNTLPLWFEYAAMRHELVEQGWTHIRSSQSTIFGGCGDHSCNVHDVCAQCAGTPIYTSWWCFESVISNFSSNCFNSSICSSCDWSLFQSTFAFHCPDSYRHVKHLVLSSSHSRPLVTTAHGWFSAIPSTPNLCHRRFPPAHEVGVFHLGLEPKFCRLISRGRRHKHLSGKIWQGHVGRGGIQKK